jgi:oligopeptide transport system substrate-binding protein
MRTRAFLLIGFVTALGVFAATVPARAADMAKTLRVAFPVAETGFDPQAVGDTYSFYICRAIFDPLYTYDYFARPVRMVPNTAAGLPQITDDGRTYTIRVRPGIYFAADPAFKGQRRELVAEDYVYSIKRIFDPKVRSYWLYVFEPNLVGLDDVLAEARRTGKFDYDAKIEGLQALDRYTLRIRFKDPDYSFRWWLTFDGLAAVAREVVEAHRDASNRVMEHPVGTGAYRLTEWVRGQKIVLEANPEYRDEAYPAPGPGSERGDAAIAGPLKGRKLPLVGRVHVSIIEEAQPRWLAFDSGQLDYMDLPSSLAGNVLVGDKLKPEYGTRGIRLHRQVEPSLQFTFFNMDDPVVGGMAPEKVALRRAIALAWDREAEIKLLMHGQALPATQPAPPGFAGHDPTLRTAAAADPAAARALLDKFGYRDRDGDGYRERPDGAPLTLVKGSTTTAIDRDRDELWKRSMDAIGVRITFVKNKWPELNKMAEAGQLMMWNLGWISSIPDADSFYSPLYSRNVGTSNDARFRHPEYDRLYERTRRLQDGPERNAAYRKMTELVLAFAPWLLNEYPYANVLTQPWLDGYKQNVFLRHQWKYYDVAPQR